MGNYTNDAFVIGFDTRRSKPHESDDDHLISGMSTVAVPVQLDFNLASALGSNQLLHEFYEFDSILKFDKELKVEKALFRSLLHVYRMDFKDLLIDFAVIASINVLASLIPYKGPIIDAVYEITKESLISHQRIINL